MELLRTPFDRVARAFRNLLMASEPPSSEEPWTIHDANLTLYSTLSKPSRSTRTRSALPPEIILQILEHPSRSILTSYVSAEYPEEAPLRIRSQRSPLGLLSSLPLSADDAKNARKVVFEFKGKDQGWSSYSSDHGTYNNSWSWYEAVVRSANVEKGEFPTEVQRFELQRNRHAGQQPETYRIELGEDHDLVKRLAEGNVIGLDACAVFPGWECQVFEARIELWGVDDLSMGNEMQWIKYRRNNILMGQWVDKALADEMRQGMQNHA